MTGGIPPPYLPEGGCEGEWGGPPRSGILVCCTFYPLHLLVLNDSHKLTHSDSNASSMDNIVDNLAPECEGQASSFEDTVRPFGYFVVCVIDSIPFELLNQWTEPLSYIIRSHPTK